MPNLINNQTGKQENIDYDQLPSTFQAGTHTLPKDASLPLKNEDGDLVSVPSDQIPNVIGKGFSFPTSKDITTHNEKIQYGEGAQNVAAATSAGALRGLTFGTSDLILPHLGVDKETLAKLKEYNPIASGVGELGSIGAGILSGVGAPSAISKAGNLASSAVRGAVAASPEAGLASRILSGVAPKVAGSALEGALYGGANQVSEAALGDPHLVAQHALSQIGQSALFGAALGSILPNPYKNEVGSLVGDLKNTMDGIVGKEPSSMVDVIAQSALPPSQKSSYIEKMASLKDNAPEIKDAAAQLGVPAFEEQLAADPGIQSFGRDLRASPTTIGMSRARAVDQSLDSVENKVGEIVTPKEAPLTDHELGQKLQKDLTDKFQSEYEPLKPLFNELETSGKAISLNPENVKSTVNDLLSNEEIHALQNSPASQIVKNAASSLADATTLSQVRAIRTGVNQAVLGQPNLRHAANVINDAVAKLEESTIDGLHDALSSDPDFPPELLQDLKNFPAQRVLVNQKYSELMNKFGEVGEAAGKKRIYGPQDFLNFINDLTPTKLANRLFTKKDPEFLNFMQEQFPDALNSMLDNQKSKIVEKAIFDGRIDPSKVLKEINKFSPEVKNLMFSDGDIKTLNAAKTYLDAFGKGGYRVEPASSVLSGINLIRHPVKGALQNATDWAGLKAVQKAIGGTETRTVSALMQVETLALKSARAISAGTKALVSSAVPFSDAVASSVVASNDMQDQYDKIVGNVQKVQDGPDGLYGHLDRSTAALHPHMPQVTQAMQQTIANANQYMTSVIPSKSKGLLDTEYKPNPQEIARVVNSYQGIVSPVSILKDLRVGILNQSKLQAIQAVHPDLLKEMQQSLATHITNKADKLQSMPYENKVTISKFLGIPLTNKGLNIQQIQSVYSIPQPPPSPQSIGKGGHKGSLTKLSISESYLTRGQKLTSGLR
jgi:hypothetical protein